jgi:NAD(P)-dependent dehydrogenase (short-subunit alcohol dehydrogenase family)
MRLADQVAIVTGATSGLGEAIALAFAREGARVAVIGRNAERGNRVVSEIRQEGGEAQFFPADVTSEPDVKKMVDDVVDRFGDLHIVVNNAGQVLPGTVADISLEDWETVFRINVTSTYLVSHYTLPVLLQKSKGSIINISSEAGLKGLKNRSAYCAAKAAVIGLTKAMAVDHSPSGIRVNSICPGTIETPMIKQLIEKNEDPDGLMKEFLSRRLTPYLGSPEEIAEAAIYFALPKNVYVTGAILSVDGGSVVK